MTVRLRPVLRFASLILVRDAVLAGAGVALMPEHLVASELSSGQLVRWGVLPSRRGGEPSTPTTPTVDEDGWTTVSGAAKNRRGRPVAS